MGKKYIIEIGRLERLYKAFIGAHGKPEITWLSPEVDLTPYTEPDIEQVRKEAYENGFVAGHLKAKKSGQSFYEDGYQKGLSDAWDAVRKLEFGTDKGGIHTDTIAEIFGTPIPNRVLRDFTASEAIEKIRQYEQEQDGLRQNIQTIVDKCGYSLDEIAAVLEKMRGEQDG